LWISKLNNMLPRKLHLEVINSFHDRVELVDNKIEELRKELGDEPSTYDPEVRDKMYKLASEYFFLTSKLWSEIDNFCEFKVKHKLDILKNEPQRSWFEEFKN